MGKPVIYQMLPRLWGDYDGQNKPNGSLEENGCGKFKYIDKETLHYLKSLSVTHVWYTGVLRHATKCDSHGCIPSHKEWVKGHAGSPYAINDYYDVNPYLAVDPDKRMEEFCDLIKRTHESGMKVIIDFVPNHVARDYGRFKHENGLGSNDDSSIHWKAENDFFYYPGKHLELPREAVGSCNHERQEYTEYPAKASGNSYTFAPEINDWYDTIKINYCDFHTPTWDKMYDIVSFWADKGVDGFRCDMVELVPASFLKWLISSVKKKNKNIIFIGEIYRKESYKQYIRDTGFDFLYDKSGLYDILRDIVRINVENNGGVYVEQWQSAKRITWNWQQLGDLQPYMLNFIENHDEQRFAGDFFGKDGKNALASLMVSALLNTAPFMIYFGQEIGERGMYHEGTSGRDGRTSIFDWWKIESISNLCKYIHGKEDALEKDRKELLEEYRKILSLAGESDAIAKGDTYDLCYCNGGSPGFNSDAHFAFLRDYQDETFLIAVNFLNRESSIDIYIPNHAFEWLKIEKSEKLNPETPIKIKMGAMNGIIMKLI